MLVCLVGQPRVGDRRLAAQRQRLFGADRVEPLVDLGVHPADEERRHRPDAGERPARVEPLLQTRCVSVHDPAVALDGEDQRDIDADPVRDRGGDRRQTGDRGGDLDEQVGPIDLLPQVVRLVDRLLGLVGQPWVDLERDATVEPARTLGHRREQVTCRADVVGGHVVDGGLGVRALLGVHPQLVVVCAALRDRGLEDGRVARHPDDVARVDQRLQRAGLEPVARQVVEPDRDTLIGELSQPVGLADRGCLRHSCPP